MHLIGRGLKQKFPEIKWVADFRDPWSGHGLSIRICNGIEGKGKDAQSRTKRRQSRDHIIVTSIGAGVKLTGDANSSKVSWIPNGWDPSDFPQSRPQTDDIFRIGHFGALHGVRNSTAVREAVSQYNKISERQIQLVSHTMYAKK